MFKQYQLVQSNTNIDNCAYRFSGTPQQNATYTTYWSNNNKDYWGDITFPGYPLNLQQYPLPADETAGNNAIMRARMYGNKFGENITGRLMTLEEAKAIDPTNYSDEQYGTCDTKMKEILYGRWNDDTKPVDTFINRWWLGDAKSNTYIYRVSGFYNNIYYINSTSNLAGIRPVLEVPKTSL